MPLRQDDALARAILETVRLPLLALDADLRVKTANDAFLRQFRVSRDETIGRLIYDLGNGQWDIPELRHLLGEILPEKSTVSDYRVEHGFERIGRRIMHLSARRIARSAGEDLILLAISDDTEREALRVELVGRIELADKLIDSVREGLLILDPDLRVHSASGSFYETFGVEPAETVGHLVYELGNGQWDIPELRQLLEDVLPRQQSFDDYEVTHTFEDIGERVMLLNGRRLDHMDLILLAIRDITESRESAARLKEVARAAHIGVFEDDRRAGSVFWSPELRGILGYPQDQPPPPAGVVPGFVHPEDKPAVAEMFAKVLDPRSDGLIYHEHRIVRPNGEVRWVQINGHVEFAKAGGERQPVLIRGVVIDVTERKVAEERQRESEARLATELQNTRVLQEISASLIPEAGEQTLYDQIVDAAIKLMGSDAATMQVLDDGTLRLVAWQGLPPDSVQYWQVVAANGRSVCGRAFAHGSRVVAEDVERADYLAGTRDLEAYRRSGLRAVQSTPLVSRSGEQLGMISTHWRSPRPIDPAVFAIFDALARQAADAIERARAVAALTESEARYRQLFDSIDQGFCMVEVRFDDGRADYRVVEANPAFYRLTGFPEAIFGRWLREAAPELEEHWYETYGSVARTGAPVRFEQSSDMLGRWFDVYAFPIDAPEGYRVGILFSDITERKRGDEHQNMLMAELDHRVKNILAVVQSIARQTLGRGQTIGPDAADVLVGRLNALAQSHALLASSRWEGARFGDIVESAVAPYRDQRIDRIVAEGTNLKVSPQATQTLHLALHELVTNAAKYGALSREDGRVIANWHLADGGDEHRLIFIWQEHGGPAIEEPPGRKGFGSLLIERTLAFELDGEVSLDFARDGLRAVIELPLGKLRVKNGQRDGGHRSDRTPRGDPTTLQDKRVLIVEDEHLVGQEMADRLQSAGCSVMGPLGTLQEALRVAVAEDLDAAVLDINLNGEFVWPAARALKARGIPLVFTTGYSSTVEMPSELKDAQRIEKPISGDQLLSILAAVVAGSSAE